MSRAARGLHDLAAIVAMLADRAPALAGELLPAGTREGHEWRCGSLAGEPGRSLAVHLHGPRAGVWKDFASGETGDALDLVAAVLFAGDKKQGIRWARAWLGLDDADPARFATARRQAEARKDAARRDEDRRRGAALRLFLAARERIAGTAADAYLRGRGIDLAQLGRQPRCLRFHPNCWNVESQRHWPALIAGITDAKGLTVAAHRTWLETHNDGRVTKAPLRDPKLTLGRYAGGSIHLWRGASSRPWRDAQPGEWLMVAEGIEDALTAIVARPDLRAAAAVSLSAMAAMTVPDAIAGVIILAQNDAPGSAAEVALRKAIAHFQALGKKVRIARPPADVKDINELAQAQRACAS